MSEEELVERPSEAVNQMNNFLGEVGGRILVRAIKKEVKQSFGIQQLVEHLDFEEVVELAKKNYAS